MKTPPDVIVCANDDMALGALEALKARNLIGKVKLIGFDALPEALAQIRDGNMTATIEQLPGRPEPRRRSTRWSPSCARQQAGPGRSTLLTPIAITKDNLDQAERLDEVK